jgi:hypothetical protein
MYRAVPSSEWTIAYRMVPKRLVSERGSEFLTMEIEAATRRLVGAKLKTVPDGSFDLDPPEDDEAPPKPKGRPSAISAIVGATFEAAVSKQLFRKLEHGQALAAIVLVPSAAWVAPVANYFKATFGDRWVLRARDGSKRESETAFAGPDAVSNDLANGFCVAGISADEKHLPRGLVGAADITIRLASPTSETIRTAIARFTKRAICHVPDVAVAGLDLHDLVSACHWAKGRHGPRYPDWEIDEVNRIINEKLLSHHPSSFKTARLLATEAVREVAVTRGEEPVLLGGTGIGGKLISRILRERDKFEVMVETKNVREARRQAQSVQLGPQGDFVNNHWEVDHCLLDILVIDEETGKIAGRPWLTAIIDRYSRCIVGFSLSFAPPSWTSVMDALRIAVMPKDWLLADLGQINNSWDCFSVPRHLTTDHGRDFKSNSMIAASSALGFDLLLARHPAATRAKPPGAAPASEAASRPEAGRSRGVRGLPGWKLQRGAATRSADLTARFRRLRPLFSKDSFSKIGEGPRREGRPAPSLISWQAGLRQNRGKETRGRRCRNGRTGNWRRW